MQRKRSTKLVLWWDWCFKKYILLIMWRKIAEVQTWRQEDQFPGFPGDQVSSARSWKVRNEGNSKRNRRCVATQSDCWDDFLLQTKTKAIPSFLACAGATAFHLFANNKYHEKYVTIIWWYYKGGWNSPFRLQGRKRWPLSWDLE